MRLCLFSKTALFGLLLISITGLTGCADLGYLMHTANGHFDIISRTEKTETLINDPETDPRLREQLNKVNHILDFANDHLDLPSNGSYSEYADIGRDYVLKNLFATEEFSIHAKRWCYPLVGCMGYRGYFDEQRLNNDLQTFQAQGLDIYIAHVDAYSTLGWFNDPLLNTFIDWSELRLAGLIFHELAHQRLYVDGDSTFNESYAVAVQQAGIETLLNQRGETKRLPRYRQYLQNRRKVIELIGQARQDLQQLYSNNNGTEDLRRLKAERISRLKADYLALHEQFEVNDGFSRWFEKDLNNAQLVSVSTYHSLVPAFRNLLTSTGENFPAFYRLAEQIGDMESASRKTCLAYWAGEPTSEQLDKACPRQQAATIPDSE